MQTSCSNQSLVLKQYVLQKNSPLLAFFIFGLKIIYWVASSKKRVIKELYLMYS